MTLNSARKLLGKEAEELTDAQLQSDIDVAELLKELFFKSLTNEQKDIVASH